MPSTTIINVPNVLTACRLVLAIAVFVMMPHQLYFASFVVFIIAASTDWIDGYWARKYQQVTQVGRIFDPFVDKIIICGTYIFLAAERPASGIEPWMAVVVMGRELLVTALRSIIEGSGGDFSAKWAAKWKMLFQCVAAASSLLALHYFHSHGSVPPWLSWTLVVTNWIAIVLTIYSGVEYVVAAAKFRSKN
jgi:CDP-diacylglycerol--glycerol-3-phosphate 3-phosphatidyltransferase